MSGVGVSAEREFGYGEAEHLRDRLSIYSRMGLAAFATLVVVIGATLRLYIAKVEAPVEQADTLAFWSLTFIHLGGFVIAVFGVVCLDLVRRARHCLKRLKQLVGGGMSGVGVNDSN